MFLTRFSLYKERRALNLCTIICVLIHLNPDVGTQKHKKLSRRSQVETHFEFNRCEYPLLADTLA